MSDRNIKKFAVEMREKWSARSAGVLWRRIATIEKENGLLAVEAIIIGRILEKRHPLEYKLKMKTQSSILEHLKNIAAIIVAIEIIFFILRFFVVT